MTNAQLAKCFFPGVRKEVLVQHISILDIAGEKRIKLELIMPLSDGRLTGMPSWVGEAYDHMGKEDAVERFTKFDVELAAMSLYCHSTEDTEKPSHVLFNVLLCAFVMTREKQDGEDEELSDIVLKFTAKVPSNHKLWSGLYPYHRKSMFVRFETTQSDLEDVKPTEDKQLPLVGDSHDAERREANSKEHDAEFTGSRFVDDVEAALSRV